MITESQWHYILNQLWEGSNSISDYYKIVNWYKGTDVYADFYKAPIVVNIGFLSHNNGVITPLRVAQNKMNFSKADSTVLLPYIIKDRTKDDFTNSHLICYFTLSGSKMVLNKIIIEGDIYYVSYGFILDKYFRVIVMIGRNYIRDTEEVVLYLRRPKNNSPAFHHTLYNHSVTYPFYGYTIIDDREHSKIYRFRESRLIESSVYDIKNKVENICDGVLVDR